ncbi:MAG: hypothetical protein MSC31_16405 [Solirubrobacteraceae bacterium MAG38_C4-C5]|nr:hypothetical protein [Candidatus Siliceabacter maunaloa]
MTRQKSFKRLVRSRMEKTGESYTAARAVLLAAEESATVERPPLTTSDEVIRRRTGRGWEEWFDLLDEWGAAELSHREIARRVAAELAIESLAWHAQAITVSYERARGLRVVGERSDGFAVTAQRTVAVPVEALFDAFVDGSLRRRWLPEDELRERTARKPRSARFDWADGETRVNVTFLEKGDGKSTVAVEHARLADAGEAERMKAFWRERLTALVAQLAGGGIDA